MAGIGKHTGHRLAGAQEPSCVSHARDRPSQWGCSSLLSGTFAVFFSVICVISGYAVNAKNEPLEVFSVLCVNSGHVVITKNVERRARAGRMRPLSGRIPGQAPRGDQKFRGLCAHDRVRPQIFTGAKCS